MKIVSDRYDVNNLQKSFLLGCNTLMYLLYSLLNITLLIEGMLAIDKVERHRQFGILIANC